MLEAFPVAHDHKISEFKRRSNFVMSVSPSLSPASVLAAVCSVSNAPAGQQGCSFPLQHTTHCSVCVCVCVCVHACVCACVSDRRAIQPGHCCHSAEGERGDKERERGRWRTVERRGIEKEGGVQAQIKPWGPGPGWVRFCYKYTGRLEVRVWWLVLGTGCHHCCSSFPQGILLRILIILSLVISAAALQDASRGRGPQAGL